MNRIEYINEITKNAARFVLEVEGFNALSQYHINIHAESFLIPVLNQVYHLNLENLNDTRKSNYPAIDLADFEKRIAFQITSTAELSKIEKTLKTFFQYKLHDKFDTLYIYIITKKKANYNETRINQLLENSFNFNINDHILDKDSFLQKINSIDSSQSLALIAKCFKHEFSDIQINQRKKKYVGGYLSNIPEKLTPNLLEITFPKKLYLADLDIDSDTILNDLNTYLVSIQKKPVKSLRPRKLIRKALKRIECISEDWMFYENKIYTFQNLNDDDVPYSKIIDKGTITSIDCSDLYEVDESKKRVFKTLLRNSLIELCRLKSIEWFGFKEVFRFANNKKLPNSKKVRWKGKNEATKTVIFEMFNKVKQHIICYRSLAFSCSFLDSEDKWFLVLNPTWSFTNPGGYEQSKFESVYMSGIKKLENNKTVYNYFRFFSYYLSHSDLFSNDYPYLKVNRQIDLNLCPKLDENKWRAIKKIEISNSEEIVEITEDTELSDKTLFD